MITRHSFAKIQTCLRILLSIYHDLFNHWWITKLKEGNSIGSWGNHCIWPLLHVTGRSLLEMNWLDNHLRMGFGWIISPTSTSLLSFIFLKHFGIETSRYLRFNIFLDWAFKFDWRLGVLKFSWGIDLVLLYKVLSFLSDLRINFTE